LARAQGQATLEQAVDPRGKGRAPVGVKQALGEEDGNGLLSRQSHEGQPEGGVGIVEATAVRIVFDRRFVFAQQVEGALDGPAAYAELGGQFVLARERVLAQLLVEPHDASNSKIEMTEHREPPWAKCGVRAWTSPGDRL